MKKVNSFFRRSVICGILGILVMTIVGCGAVHHTAKFESDFLPKPDTRVEVGTVVNETGQTFDIDISKMFMDAIAEVLAKDDLLWTENLGSEHLIITTKIVEYEKGDAFKRWLLPGWGSTVLSVHCELKESTGGRMIGSVDARRTVSVGGGYTIGAWRTIMASVAKDVVKELRSKIGR